MSTPCPCYSGQSYEACCRPYHLGSAYPKTSLELMRSRYGAYVKKLVDYIIQTSHPTLIEAHEDPDEWKNEIQDFCDNTRFTGLDILDFEDIGQEGTVTFIAHLQQEGQDVSFKEKSHFVKEDDHWYYLNGEQKSLHEIS